jgi:LacI family transcriptional regulator
MSSPTLRSLAKQLGFSRTTISDSLRNSPRVSPDIAEKVRAGAAAAGYKQNPLASALMSDLRRSRAHLFRGTIGAITLDEAERPPHATAFFDELINGARVRADALGYNVDKFLIGKTQLSWRRLEGILRSRRIEGLMLLPAWADPDYSKLDWSRYAGVYCDYLIEHPALNSVCSDHYRSMMTALQTLHTRGYQRLGVVLHRPHDARLQHRWEAAAIVFQLHAAGIQYVPPLVRDSLSSEEFKTWFRKHSPDVVLAHHDQVMDWMKECGAQIPTTHGFCCLNVLMRSSPCAGLDLQPRLLGEHAIEGVIAQLQRNEHGVPSKASLTTTAAIWVEGPTVRHPPVRTAKDDRAGKQQAAA